MKAYLFVKTGSNKEQTVLEKLQKLEEVKTADIVFGEWDIVSLIEVKSTEELGNFVMDKIRHIPDVKLTSTMILWSH
jgi:DNA-binding Lrp family transcriptional regulator